MESKVYKYMDWPEIEAVVYGEEAAPRDLMAPRMTADGVLVQGFFPDADSVEVLVDTKTYTMEKQDEAGYFAVMLPMRKAKKSVRWQIHMHFLYRLPRTKKRLSVPVCITMHMKNWERIRKR